MQESATRRFFFRRAANMWESNYSIFSILRCGGYYTSSKLLKSFVERRTKLENEQEKENYKELLLQANLRNKSSEVAITMILGFGAWAREPILFLLQEIGMPIGFFYGSYDWMSRAYPDSLLEQGLLSDGTSIFTVEDSGH